MKASLLATLSIVAATVSAAELRTFQTQQLCAHFWCEGASFGDFDRDGKMDIVAGPYWYRGPEFTERHEYYPATQTFTREDQVIPGFEGALGIKNTYSDNFFAFTRDFNGERVELVRADTGGVFFKASGRNSETMQPVVVDLAAQRDREIFIRLVDALSPGWGHLNFDDFRFHEKKPRPASTRWKRCSTCRMPRSRPCCRSSS